MRLKRVFLTFIFLVLGFAAEPSAGTAAQPAPSEGVTLSEAQWSAVQDRFESDITSSITWFENYENRKKNLAAEISELQDKTSRLREETRDESNLFKEIHLKELLNELEGELEKNSDGEHEADTKQKDFEEKCLSLIDLYNGHIEYELESGEMNAPVAELDSKVNLLSGLARDRNRIQVILSQYGRKDDKEKLASIGTVSSMKTDDKETLQLTLDLFKDRQKTLRDQIDKWSLELDGLQNELKLQGEMKDFLKDIQSMNEDSSFAQGNLKQEDLEFLSGDSQKKKLVFRLEDTRQKILKGQKLLAQIGQLLTKVQDRLDSLSEDRKP